MNGWLDWREIEKHNDWGAREKTDDMGRRWDRDAQMWDARWKSEEAFTKRQADALALLPTDTVLDIGCGTGPLTMNIASRVRKVIAQDFGEEMLALVRSNAAARGLANVETLQGNWHTMEPGVDLPVCDVAITRWSPAQGNILKMSRCATRYCYSLSTCAPFFSEDGEERGGFWCRSTVDESMNRTPRPCARKYGFNVHFNLLYDHGANPTINYVTDEQVEQAATKDELIERLTSRHDESRKREGFAPTRPLASTADRERAERMLLRNVRQEEDGTWTYRRSMSIVVMGWDPREITC